MRKVIKIFLIVVSSLLLTAIAIHAAVWLLLFLPSVQERAGRIASDRVSELLGARVTFENVSIQLFNAATFDGLYLEDHRGDTMLYVGKFSAGIDPWALMRRREIVLTDVCMEHGDIRVRKYEDGRSNVGEILARLRSGDGEAVDVRAAMIRMNDMAFSYRTHTPEQTIGAMNFSDLVFSDISMRATGLSVSGDTVSMRLDRLSLREKCGFVLDGLSGDMVTIGPDGVRVGETQIETPDSEIRIDYAHIARSGEIGIEIRSSIIGAQTAGYFLPDVRLPDTGIRDLNATVTVRGDDISGRFTAAGLDNTRVSTIFAVRGLQDMAHADFSVTVDSLTSNSADIQRLVGIIIGTPLSDTLSQQIGQLGTVVLTGSFGGSANDFTARADLRTAQGSGQADLAFSPSAERGRTSFSGTLSLDNLELGALLDIADMGRLSAAADVKGAVGPEHFSANVAADLAGLEYNGYNYHGIRLDGAVDGRRFAGTIGSHDPNLDMDFSGLADFNGTIPRYDFTAEVRNADLARLNIDRRDSVSRVSFTTRVEAAGRTLDDMNGRVRIADVLYLNATDSISTGEVVLTGQNNEESKLLTLRSDFANATFRGNTSYTRLGEQLERTLHAYLPSLAGSASPSSTEGQKGGASIIEVEIKEIGNVADIFFPGLIVADGSKIAASFDPGNGYFSLAAHSDYMEMGGSFVSNFTVDAHNSADSVALTIHADEIYGGGLLLPGVSLTGSARDDRVRAFADFIDPADDRSAQIGGTVDLTCNPASGALQALLRFTPSYYRQGSQRWDVSAGDILFDDGRVEVDDFAVAGDGQSLRISGTASANARDTLRMELSNFDINPLSSILNLGYQFYGRASGQAYLQSVMHSPILNARIELDSMMVDNVNVPQLVFLSNWEADNSRVSMAVLEHGVDSPIIYATYRPDSRRIDGRMNLRGIDLSLLDPHYEGTLSRTVGRADLEATIGGYGRKIKLNGMIDILEYRSTVDFMNVPYSTVGTTQMAIRDNVLVGEAIPLADPEGNRGTLDAHIDLNKLNNVAYEFGIRADDMLLLNTTRADNELFYGRVYGAGAADIRGSKRGVTMNITAATAGDSRFYMPLEENADMTDADFVRFVESASRQMIDTSGYSVRKRMIMNREERRRIVSSGNITTDIALTVSPNTLVELLIDPQTGHTVRARGNGSLNMHLSPRVGEFTMYGDYRISEGFYLFTLENIIERPFAIEPGSNIQWTGDPIDALLDISGVYGLKSSIGAAVSGTGFSDWRMRIPIECRIRLTDRLSLPTLSFNITAPGATPEVQNILSGFLNTQEMIATQFFFLLATGNFYDYEGSAGNIGAAAGSATAFDFLSNQLSNWISSDRFNIGIHYRPQTQTTSDEWGIDFSQQLWGDRLLLEVEGSYDTRNNSQAVYSENMKNFTGDFYITGLLDRVGNLRAKLFSRTITRFDENQGLQEWGAGVYFTKDFNTFEDIIRRFRKRLTEKKEDE